MSTKDYIGSMYVEKSRFDRDRNVMIKSVEHSSFAVKAVSKHEALGMGMVIVRKLFPYSEGWVEHHVTVQELNFVTPDNVVWVPNPD